MLRVLLLCLAAFTLLFVYLLFVRVRMSETSARLDALLAAREEGEDR
jgi:hypothetical protein